MLFAGALPLAERPRSFVAGALVFTMIMHMLLGSLKTIMSVYIPVLTAVAPDTIPAAMMALLLNLAINTHFLLPFHHVLVMIGEGEGDYSPRHTIKYGVFLTVLLFISVFCIYIPYWRLVFGGI